MLPRENRLTSGDQIREVIKRGKKSSSESLSLHLLEVAGKTQIAFVVGRQTGNAVVRNLVKRRLREASRELLKSNPEGIQLVVRARDNAGTHDYVNLKAQLMRAFERLGR